MTCLIFCPMYGGSACHLRCSSCSWMGRYSRQQRQKSAWCTSDMCLKNHFMLDHSPHSSHCFRTLPDLTRPALSSSTPGFRPEGGTDDCREGKIHYSEQVHYI